MDGTSIITRAAGGTNKTQSVNQVLIEKKRFLIIINIIIIHINVEKRRRKKMAVKSSSVFVGAQLNIFQRLSILFGLHAHIKRRESRLQTLIIECLQTYLNKFQQNILYIFHEQFISSQHFLHTHFLILSKYVIFYCKVLKKSVKRMIFTQCKCKTKVFRDANI